MSTKNSTKRKNTLIILTISTWLIVVFTGFWYFSARHLASFNDYWVSFKGDELQSRANNGQISLFHLVDKRCPCTRFSLPHIEKLKSTFTHIEHKVLIHGETDKDASELSEAIRRMAPASPAVLIFSSQGTLAYFGPYNQGAICGQGEDIVASIVDSLERGDNPHWINQEAIGCMCQWQALQSS
ncbi:MAG: hypothetical protein JKY66_04875 [Spongiibacteraceae bacterium]|nr:hypothetical protein [Spongiibacteraceae bacterium]